MDRCVPETPTAPVCATARRAPRPAAVRAALALALGLVAAATFTGRAHARASQPFAARAGLDLARSAAMAWAEDAVLIYVENDEPLDARGASTRWGYLFFSASHDESRAYSIENGKIVVAETLALKFEAPPLGADWIDSGAALTVAEEASREFRGKAGGKLSNMVLVRGAFQDDDPDPPAWTFIYSAPHAPSLFVVVDAAAGKVKRTWRG